MPQGNISPTVLQRAHKAHSEQPENIITTLHKDVARVMPIAYDKVW